MFAAVYGMIFEAFSVLVLLCICYFLYDVVAFSSASHKFLDRSGLNKNHPAYLFLFQKVSGFILLGLLPAILYHLIFVYDPPLFQLSVGYAATDWVILSVLIAVIIMVTNMSSRKRDMYERFPQMRIKQWGYAHVLISLGGWSVYLLTYEYLFRGLFLFSWTAAFGPVWAIAANVIIYSLVHIPNGRKEAVGAIFFGTLLCLVSLHTGSFIMAFILHLTLSVSTEMHAVYFNPEMGFRMGSNGKINMPGRIAD